MNIKTQTAQKLLAQKFAARFGSTAATHPNRPPRIALAPGRVNLIGEHTDYNGGLVLPMAIDRHTAVVFAPNKTDRVRVWSATVAAGRGEASDEFGLTLESIPRLKDPDKHWANYVRGVAAALLKRGVKLKGGDLYIEADLPNGAGLSSSAALEVATGLALQDLAGGKKLAPQELALAAQEAEHTYPGVKCGIMDQSIVARGRPGHALLLDCRDLSVRHVPISLKRWSFAIFDTGVRHELASSEYNKRRAQCEKAAKRMKVDYVRELTLENLLAGRASLNRDERKRVRHILSEDLRTQQFADELSDGNVETLGRLLQGSHDSLKNDYEVSCRELDYLVTTLCSQPLAKAVAGARMTGGGFGGSVVALIQTSAFKRILSHLQEVYRKDMKRELGGALLVQPACGARIV